MFSSLAAYLFGNANGDTADTATNSTTTVDLNLINGPDSEEDIRLKVVPTESEEEDQEEWLIVDKDEEESSPQTDSEEEIPFVEIKRQRPGSSSSSRHRRLGSGSALSTNSDGIPSLAQGTSLYGISTASCMGESWLVTPPPCFTSTGPIDMVTSPFENLLIEHPSMSVYHRIRSSRDNGIGDDMSLGEYGSSFTLPIIIPAELTVTTHEAPLHPVAGHDISVRTARVVVSRRGDRTHLINPKQAKEIVLIRDAQKNREKKTRQVLSRGATKRNNQVREYNSKSGRPRRADMQHCKILSGANNNRKC